METQPTTEKLMAAVRDLPQDRQKQLLELARAWAQPGSSPADSEAVAGSPLVERDGLLAVRSWLEGPLGDPRDVRNTTTIVLTPVQLENLVRTVVREELGHLNDVPTSILHDWRHEGPDDPEGDARLLEDALILSHRYRDAPEELMSLEEFEQELAR